MVDTVKLGKYKTHTFYVAADFTAEEIERGNRLAVAVIEHDRKICKRCGRDGTSLYFYNCNKRK